VGFDTPAGAIHFNLFLMEKNQEEAARCLEHLKEVVKPGCTLYTIDRKPQSRGVTWHLSIHCLSGGKLHRLTYSAGIVLGLKLQDVDGKRSLVRKGGNMDMGFDLANSVALLCGLSQSDWNHEWL
jgi:hypothetical protein